MRNGKPTAFDRPAVMPADQWGESAKPGDVIGFSSYGCDGIWLNLATGALPRRGWSHVGILAAWNGKLLLFESTMLYRQPCYIAGHETAGVQAHDFAQRVQHYNGRVTWCPLTFPLRGYAAERLTGYCTHNLGKAYDAMGAFRSRGLSLIERFTFRGEDLASVFCSELVADALRYVERFACDNASRMNPNRLRRALHKQKAIRGEIVLKD